MVQMIIFGRPSERTPQEGSKMSGPQMNMCCDWMISTTSKSPWIVMFKNIGDSLLYTWTNLSLTSI